MPASAISLRTLLFTATAMVAFAANSLLCRAALRDTSIDPAAFTMVRIGSGAAALGLILLLRGWRGPGSGSRPGSWRGALFLFLYAAAFSFAYLGLTAATGALLLFGAVQLTMVVASWCSGERPGAVMVVGALLAMAGLGGLLLPGVAAPAPLPSALMLVAGMAWGAYSLLGRKVIDPLRDTAGNFIRAVPMVAVLGFLYRTELSTDPEGIVLAGASGALASGAGYAIWYAAVPALGALRAATVQLSVPVIAAGGGILLLGEPLTVRLLLAAIAVIGGIALVLSRRAVVPLPSRETL